jgi:hypothetical protein
MHLPAEGGVQECVLSTRTDNSRMNALATQVGFRQAFEQAGFSLPVP